MGQKIDPIAYRLGVTKKWPVRWFFSSISDGMAGRRSGLGRKQVYAFLLEEDELIRKIVRARISQAGIADIEIERTQNDVRIYIRAARPGFVIGRGGKGIEELSSAIQSGLKKLRGEYKTHLSVNVEELKRNEVSATHTAQQIAWDIEKRLPYRRTLKKTLDQLSQHKDVKGAKLYLSGRLGGAEIARREVLRWGSLPLQTLRANIDYGEATAFTTYGTIGVKVWIYKGEVQK